MTGPSPVAFRLGRVPRPDTNPSPRWLRMPVDAARPDHGIGYLLGQGLYQPASEAEGRPHPQLARRSHLPPDEDAVFAVRVAPGRRNGAPAQDYVREVVGISLWAAATFGGLGARTHRGFGGFDLDGLGTLCAAAAAAAGPRPPGDPPPARARGRTPPPPPPRPQRATTAGSRRRALAVCPHLDPLARPDLRQNRHMAPAPASGWPRTARLPRPR